MVARHLNGSFLEKHYELVRPLGQGTFGHIQLVRDRRTGQLRVSKVINIANMHPVVLRMMRTEVQVLSALDHPSIIRLYEFAEDERRGELALVMEYVQGGSCLELLTRNDGLLSEALVARLMYQLLVALGYCHARGIAHRDLKPENVMLTEVTGSLPDIRLIDFGLATPYKGQVKELAGTVAYLAPEVAQEQAGWSTAADVWAAGATCFELLAGASAFGRPADNGDGVPVLERLCNFSSFGKDLEGFLDTAPGSRAGRRTADARDFLTRLLTADPEARPTTSEALQHPWLQQHRMSDAVFSTEQLRNLDSFVRVPPLARACLYAVAAKEGQDHDEGVRAARLFVELDADGDGRLGEADLRAALARSCGWLVPVVEAEAIMQTSSEEEGIGFTDFLAASLSAKFCNDFGYDVLVDRAFMALDHNRDGLVLPEDVLPILRISPHEIPSKPFGNEDWRRCILADGGHDDRLGIAGILRIGHATAEQWLPGTTDHFQKATAAAAGLFEGMFVGCKTACVEREGELILPMPLMACDVPWGSADDATSSSLGKAPLRQDLLRLPSMVAYVPASAAAA